MTIRDSSVIAVTRGAGDDLEVFWVRRKPEMRFMGGYYAFFGGSVEPDDGSVPLCSVPPAGAPPVEFFACAARELFEELGLLLIPEGVLIAGVDSNDDLSRARRKILDGELAFGPWLQSQGLCVGVTRFHPAGRWQTPDFFDIRYATEFFAIHLNELENRMLGADEFILQIGDEEHNHGEWVRAPEALQRWRSADVVITPPTRFTLEAIDRASTVTEVFASEEHVETLMDGYQVVDGIWMMPQRTPTIPPATHTNCVMVGEDDFVIIDPGSSDDAENARLFVMIDELIALGRSPLAIVLTHHHPDHIGGVTAVAARYELDVWAHAWTQELVGDQFEVAKTIADGDVIELGEDSLTAYHTPGHASDHLAFHHARTNVIICGDLIASLGTILVNPPDGHMGDYLESLERMRDLQPSAIIPAHGWVVPDPVARLEFYMRHRLEREDKVLAALASRGRAQSAIELVPEAYADTPEHIWPIAARSAEAHLLHLVEIGKAAKIDGVYRAV